MRTIETLAREYPNKTGKELFEIQEQDKLEDQAEYEKANEAKLNFVNDIKENGGYFRGRFGVDQRFMYNITNIFLDNGVMYVDIEEIVVFLGSDNGVVEKGNFNIQKKSKKYNRADIYDFDIWERVTKKEWEKLNNYIIGIEKFWKED